MLLIETCLKFFSTGGPKKKHICKQYSLKQNKQEELSGYTPRRSLATSLSVHKDKK